MGNFLSGLILWPLLALVLSPIVLPLVIIRLLADLLAQSRGLTPITHGEQLYTCPDGKIWALLTGGLRLDSKINLIKFRELFKEKFITNQKDSIFYKTVLQFWGYGYTRPVSKIDLNLHIREVRSVQGEGFNATLNRLWNDMTSLQENWVNSPPWEVLVCNDIQGVPGSLIVVKIHHALADGYSMVSIIDQLTGNRSPYIVKPWVLSPWRKIKLFLMLPLGFLKNIYNLDVCLVRHPFSMKGDPSTDIPLTTSTATLDFNKIYDIRKAEGCRVLPIFMCLQVEAVKRFLTAHKRIDDGTQMQEYFRHIINLPIPEHPAAIENRLCVYSIMGDGRVPLQEANLQTRLRITNKDFEDYEGSDGEKVAALLRNIPYILPNPILSHFQNMSKYPLFSTISTLLLSPEPYVLQGTKISKFYFGTTFDNKNCGLRGVTLFTFTKGSQVDCSIVGSTDLFKTQAETDEYADKYLVEVLDDYWKLCCNKL